VNAFAWRMVFAMVLAAVAVGLFVALTWNLDEPRHRHPMLDEMGAP